MIKNHQRIIVFHENTQQDVIHTPLDHVSYYIVNYNFDQVFVFSIENDQNYYKLTYMHVYMNFVPH